MDGQNVGVPSLASSNTALACAESTTSTIGIDHVAAAAHGLQQSTSSIYSQAVSTLQSPPHQFTATSPPRFSGVASPQFVSPVRMSSTVQLTSLQPVTPSRVNSTPQEICGGAIRLSDAPDQVAMSQTLLSPPTPFRVIPSGNTHPKPIITKKGKGKISVTFSPSILANQIRAQSSSAMASLSMFSQCLSQFLSRSDTPSNIPTTVESVQRSESIKTTASHLPSHLNIPSAISLADSTARSDESAVQDSTELDVPMQRDSVAGEIAMDPQSDEDYHPVYDEDEEDEEERKTVTNITKALNINIDMYQEMKKRRKKREVSTKLPKEVQGLMGEANICFARGDCDSALQMCMEIIRTGPWCPEPYELLAILYEEKGDSVKHLQYSLLAAHLQVGDVDNWLTLAKSCEEAGFLEQASHCYSKAMKLKPNDYKIMWAAAVIQQQLGNIHRSLSLFKAVVKVIPSSEANRRMTLAQDIAKTCHANSETALGLEVMDEVAVEYPKEVRYEDVNVMCELAMLSKQYRKVFDILMRHCNVKVQYNMDETNAEASAPTLVEVPPDLPADLKCKCVLASIPLDCVTVVQTIFEEMCALDSSDFGDLQYDIADLFMEEKQYRMALVVLDILVQSEGYSQPAVWMKKGECHQQLGEELKEIKCFKKVTEKAPGYAKAYIQLCQVLRKLNQYKEAVEVIQVAESYELEDGEQMLLHYETFQVYKEWAAYAEDRKHDKLCKAGDLGLLMLANKLESALMFTKTILLRRVKSRNGGLKGDVRVTRKVGKYYYKHEDKKSLVAKGSADAISNDNWWEIFVETCQMLCNTERYVDGVTLVEAALTHGSWSTKPQKKMKMEQMACSLCMLGGNFFLAYTYMRTWLLANSSVSALWNLFNQITVRSEDQRHHRFCLRFLIKDPESIALAVLTGHNSLATGTYKHSLAEYMRAHRQIPTEPMYALLIGIIYIHIASQRFTTHKNTLVIQAIAFLNRYRKQRKCDQEVHFNIGRMYHQIGMTQYAVQWYKKALETPLPVCDVQPELIDLKSEIAYNLATLYRKSGNIALAMDYLKKYCVV